MFTFDQVSSAEQCRKAEENRLLLQQKADIERAIALTEKLIKMSSEATEKRRSLLSALVVNLAALE